MKKFFALLFVFSLISFFALLLFFKDNYLYSGSLHLGMFSVAMFFLWKKDWKGTLNAIGVPGDLKNNIIYTIAGFFGLVASLTLMFIAFQFFEIENDSGNVAEIIKGLPIFVPLLAIIIAPFTEELFFRALLVPKIGIIPSALVFSVSHLSYGSTAEIAGALVVGILFGIIYKYSKSVVPCILVHFGYNLLSILVMLLVVS